MTNRTNSIIPNIISTQRRHIPTPCNQTSSLLNAKLNSNTSLLIHSLQIMLPIRRNSNFKRPIRSLKIFRNSITPRRQPPTPNFRITTRTNSMINMRNHSTSIINRKLKSTLTRIRNLINTSIRFIKTRRLRMIISGPTQRNRNTIITSIRYIIIRTISRSRQLINNFKRLTRITRKLHTRNRMRISRHKSQQSRLSTTFNTMIIRFRSITQNRQTKATPNLTRQIRHRNIFSMRLRLIMFMRTRLINPIFRPIRNKGTPTNSIRMMTTHFRNKSILSIRTKRNNTTLTSRLARDLRTITRALRVRSHCNRTIQNSVRHVYAKQIYVKLIGNHRNSRSQPTITNNSVPFRSNNYTSIISRLRNGCIPVIASYTHFISSSTR